MNRHRGGKKYYQEREYWAKHLWVLDTIKINPRCRRIIEMRYALGEHRQPMILTEIAKALSRSPERVRQIEVQAKSRVNHHLRQAGRVSIVELDLNTRTLNGLAQANLLTVRTIIEAGSGQLSLLPNFGQVSLEDARQALRNHQLGPFYLRGDVPEKRD